MRRFLLSIVVPGLVLALVPGAPALGQSNAFDLVGPSLAATVTRDGTTLPIGQVPSLNEGDRVAVRADLPADQSTRYRLVLAFLRGATNPPPKDWFVSAETWTKKHGQLDVVVPRGATQAVMLLAPEVGGGLDAMRDAVRGRPGVFVRAAQDLHQASLDRARLEAFVAGVARIEAATPERIGAASTVLAEALGIKLNAECLTRPRAVQAACLTQTREAMILQSGRDSTVSDALTGTPTDVAYRIAATREGGSGYYSPYIGLARDLVRLFGAFRSPQYQYLPALALGRGETIRLQLNTPPSFRNPRSALVVPLPPIGPAPAPLWRAAAQTSLCAGRPGMVVPLENAPLLFATDYARDLEMRIATADGRSVAVPVAIDADRGGVALAGTLGTIGGRPVSATLSGRWGFDAFTGPRLPIQFDQPDGWAPRPDANVVVGRDHPLLLRGGASACVEQVALRGADGAAQPVAWKPAAGDEIVATLPLGDRTPGPVTLLIAAYGSDRPLSVPLVARAEASRLDRFVVHEGDREGVLSGARLDQVAALTIGDRRFVAGALTRGDKGDRLTLAADTPVAAPAGARAAVALRDGRSGTVAVTLAPPRPQVAVVGRAVEATTKPLVLPDGMVPPDATLRFSVRVSGGVAGPDDALEVAGEGGAVRLTLAAGTAQRAGDTLVAAIEPRRALGPAATGPIRVRAWRGGAAGDWQTLATVARLPAVTAVDCTAAGGDCLLTGGDLFLIAAVATAPDMAGARTVPAGLVAPRIAVPRPVGGALWLRLYDAPDLPVRVDAGG